MIWRCRKKQSYNWDGYWVGSHAWVIRSACELLDIGKCVWWVQFSKWVRLPLCLI